MSPNGKKIKRPAERDLIKAMRGTSERVMGMNDLMQWVNSLLRCCVVYICDVDACYVM